MNYFSILKRYLPILLLLVKTNAQISYSGSINPSKMVRLSDQTEISLPFRIAEAEVGYSLGNFEIKTNSALEYRWSNGENELQFREAYLVWYPSWGEVKLGKQIHAWGAVDGNNPTDNLNPYDYYYMFLPGAERKVGTVSGSLKYYWNDWQIEGVFIPEHEGNRVPFGESDFPFGPPADLTEFIIEENSSEFGLQLQTSIMGSDIGFNYLNGYDRSFTSIGLDYSNGLENNIPILGYRKTQMLGINLVSFIHDFTLRSEFAFFSSNNHHLKHLIADHMGGENEEEGEYFQFVSQFEYTTQTDIMISCQLIGQEILYDSWDDYYDNNLSPSPGSVAIVGPIDRLIYFKPGMGTPFASFTDLGLMLSASANYFDDALELMGNTFIDLKDSQFMLGVSAKYSPMDNLKLNLSISKFMGEEGTQFNSMEDFSHFQLGLEYHF